MTDTAKDKKDGGGEWSRLNVAPSPHIAAPVSTRRMMVDVLLALLPVLGVSFYVFGWFSVFQALLATATCVVVEAVSMLILRRPVRITDGSAVVTGLILAMSLPGTAPWYVTVIGASAGIFLGKVVFGGLGQNIFNPAMVGRAFVMIAFPAAMGAAGYVDAHSPVQAVTQATPLTALKQMGQGTPLTALLLGNTNGSLGETSALACLLGGMYLVIRRTASWEIPAGILAAAGLISAAVNHFGPGTPWDVWHHLAGGALLFGAFYIATDPVTSPLTSRGKWIFGVGIGVLVMILRYLSGYPEGVMFSILLMNAAVPLINRLTVPEPVGGHVRKAR